MTPKHFYEFDLKAKPGPCPICGFVFAPRAHGKTNHYKAHARRGKVMEVFNPLGPLTLPYGYMLESDLSYISFLEAIFEDKKTQKEIAALYAAEIIIGGEDWPRINAAIVTRWSPSGLDRVKRAAWAAVNKRNREWVRTGTPNLLKETQ